MQAVDLIFFRSEIVVKSVLSHFGIGSPTPVVAVCMVYIFPSVYFQLLCVFKSKVCLL